MKKLVFLVLAIIMLALAVVGNLNIPVFAEEIGIDLVDYPRESVEVGWGELKINKGLDNGTIDAIDASGKLQVYERGLTAHAPSMLTYDVSGKLITRVTAAGGGSREREKGENRETRKRACERSEATMFSSGTFKSPLCTQYFAPKKIAERPPKHSGFGVLLCHF